MTDFRLKINNIAFITVVIILFIIIMLPVYWLVQNSLKIDDEIFRISPSWIPINFTLDHYRDLIRQFDFDKHMINTIIISVGSTLISLVLGVPAAYGLSRFRFFGSNTIILIVMIVRFFTPAALVIPLYDMMSWMKLIDSPISIIIGTTIINLPLVVWIMKGFIDELPEAIEEAAKIDGCSHFRVFTNIVLPCTKSALVTAGLFSFTAAWGDFLFGISFSQSLRSMPATVAIATMDTGFKVYWGAMLSGGTVLCIPIVIITLLLQRFYIKGITMGAIK